MEYDKRLELIKSYRSPNDLLLVKATLNEQHDTTFHINKREIKGCFFGTNAQGQIRVIYDYRKGGLRDYRFDDAL